MAFLLDINPNQSSKNDRITFPDISLTGDFLIRCRCEIRNHVNTPAGMLFGGGNSGGGVEIYRNGSLGIQLFINGTSVGAAGNVWPYYDDTSYNPRYVDLRRVGSTLTVEIGGSVVITVTTSATLKINTIGSRGTSFYLGFLFYDLEITNGAFYRKFDANLYDPAAPNTLKTTDGNGQGTLSNFPNDDSQWVSYTSGEPEPVNQQHESGGSTGRIVSTIVNSEVVNEQSVSSGGSSNRNVALSVTSEYVNSQEFDTSGAASITKTLVSETAFQNEQSFSSAGAVAVQRNIYAATEFVDEQSNVQEHESGGTTARQITASAVTSVIEQQEFSSGGFTEVTKVVIATTEFVDSYSNDQLHESGGSTSRNMTLVSGIDYVNEQQFLSGGVVSFTVRAYAETEFYDDGFVPVFTKQGLGASVVQSGIGANVVKQGYAAKIIQ